MLGSCGFPLCPCARKSGMITRKPASASSAAWPYLIQLVCASEKIAMNQDQGLPPPISCTASECRRGIKLPSLHLISGHQGQPPANVVSAYHIHRRGLAAARWYQSMPHAATPPRNAPPVQSAMDHQSCRRSDRICCDLDSQNPKASHILRKTACARCAMMRNSLAHATSCSFAFSTFLNAIETLPVAR